MENECKYKTTVGLEIHAELKTKTKMFCQCKNDTEEKRPNVNVCPVCMGHPGTLPVLNKEAIEDVIKVGIACESDIADFTEWDRKNYFYPDIPKGYQISQYKYPIVSGGYLNGVRLTRIHLEEDTAKSSHDQGDFSLVDFNRSSVPLMELVTEPVIHSGKEASDFAKELQLLLQYLGVGDANMEKGEMRVEANISVSDCEGKLGTKVEVKNLNSFKTVEKAIAYETERHIEALERGEKIVQETRGWDEAKQKTYSQRIKEDSHDYRYFPDPDLPKMMISEVFDLKKIKEELPELPWERRNRYLKDYSMKPEDADMLVSNTTMGNFFDEVIPNKDNLSEDLRKSYINFVTNDLVGLLKKSDKHKIPSPENFRDLMGLFTRGEINSRVAKDILAFMVVTDQKPNLIMISQGLQQQSDEGVLKILAEKLIAENPTVVADFKSGKEASLQYLVGQAMKVTKGSANPQVIKKILLSVIG